MSGSEREFLAFQPSPDPKAGCDDLWQPEELGEILVSTLTRPEGRVRPRRYGTWFAELEFQPSPDPKAGCDHPLRLARVDDHRFQPSPDPKAGCDKARRLSSWMG